MKNVAAHKGSCPKGQSSHGYIQEPHGFAGECRKQGLIIYVLLYVQFFLFFSGLFTLLENLSVYSLGMLWVLLIHSLYYGGVSWNSFFMDDVFIILVNVRGCKIAKSK